MFLAVRPVYVCPECQAIITDLQIDKPRTDDDSKHSKQFDVYFTPALCPGCKAVIEGVRYYEEDFQWRIK